MEAEGCPTGVPHEMHSAPLPVALTKTYRMACFSPRWESEMSSFTPVNPRVAS